MFQIPDLRILWVTVASSALLQDLNSGATGDEPEHLRAAPNTALGSDSVKLLPVKATNNLLPRFD
jgi:hypothetical protein